MVKWCREGISFSASTNADGEDSSVASAWNVLHFVCSSRFKYSRDRRGGTVFQVRLVVVMSDLTFLERNNLEKLLEFVVLMTPDDEVRLKEELRKEDDPAYESELTGQARPNVLFEAGMAVGRHPNRTVIVELGQLRPFSDIGGRHVVKLDDSTAARQLFAERLRASGCSV